ncbi:MAG: D-alanyl-D-alanine-carboxypeptidase/D-alanyl-D-alanine-endopeptidase [Brevundimonas sp.]|jgi:D-alanyl-D-alanine-carboxypeptidase/D-alanyl-D-alanine-endopeptidase|uniref:serine hydrolase domain-containing protein n=1 Tax=Brevundimonas sp. TaxID=1871086 RepID=UPI0039E47C18
MTRFAMKSGGAILALVLSWGSATAADLDLPPAVEASVRSAVDDGGRIGVVLGYSRDGETTFFGYGSTALDQGAPVDADTIFEVGSVTKVFTAEMLAARVLHGAVTLDTPLAAIWPDRRIDPALTLADLATHRAGLPRNIPAAALTNGDDDSLLAALDEVSGAQGASYSNAGMAILARALVVESGQTLMTLLEQSITGPLGLDSTGYRVVDPERLARPHIGQSDVSATRVQTAAIAHGAGGLYTTARDLMILLESHQPDPSGAIDTPADLALAGVDGVPLGWRVHEGNGSRILHHGGEAEGYQAFIGLNQNTGVRVVLLANSSVEDDLQQIALHLLDPQTPLPSFQQAQPVAAFDHLTGTYEIEGEEDGSSITLVNLGDGLGYVETGPDGAVVRRSRLEAVGPAEFRLRGTPIIIRFSGADPDRARLIVGDQQLSLVRTD